jgi:hypothetical protein
VRAFLAALLSVVAATASWPAAAEALLRAKDVRSLHVLEAARNPLTLMITGSAASGAVSVESIATEVRGDSLYVLVEIGPAQPRLSPSFEFSIIVPDGIAHVRFGPDGDAIWPR